MQTPIHIRCDCGGSAGLSSNRFDAANVVECPRCHKLLEVSPYFYANRLVIFMPMIWWALAIAVSLMPLLGPRSAFPLTIDRTPLPIIAWGLVAFVYFLVFGPLVVKPITLVVWMKKTNTDARRTRAKFAAFGGDHIAFGAHVYAFLAMCLLVEAWHRLGNAAFALSPVLFYLACVVLSLLGALAAAHIFFRDAPLSQDAAAGGRHINF